MQRITFESLIYYQFDHLSSHLEITHGLFTRLGGHSRPPWASLNAGRSVGDDPAAVQANLDLIARAAGTAAADMVSPHQIHGAAVCIVDERHKGQIIPQCDALITQTPGLLLTLRFADCTPILLYDPIQSVVSLVHAGWRGAAAGIVQAAVQKMGDAFGCRPADILAGIGPAIGPCCYEVGQDVYAAIRQALPHRPDLLSPRRDGHWHLDLWQTNAEWLRRAGVQQIQVAGTCTACHTDEWFSHRAEHGATGRFAAVIGIREVK